MRWQALGTSSALRLQRVLPHISSSSSLSDFDGFFSFPRREGKISQKRKERKLDVNSAFVSFNSSEKTFW